MTVEANRATTKAIPSGISILPSMPERKNKGRKQATMINVEFRIGIRTSFEPSKTISMVGRRSVAGLNRFSRKRLYTFSTSTIASSTNEPIAIAKPPKLIVLIVNPKACITRIAINIDKGRATREMIVVRKFIRKKNNTTITKTAPSSKASWMLWIELLIKRDCLKMSVETSTSSGKVLRSSWIEASSLSVSSRVLVPGCLVTVTSTAGLPFSEATPNLGVLAPI